MAPTQKKTMRWQPFGGTGQEVEIVGRSSGDVTGETHLHAKDGHVFVRNGTRRYDGRTGESWGWLR